MSSREKNAVVRLFNKLTKAPLEFFPEPHQRLIAPDQRGVYIIYSPRGKVLHVGRTPRARGGIAQRLRNHLYTTSSFSKRFLKGKGHLLRGKYKFRCLIVDSSRKRALLEAYAIGRLCPAHLGLGNHKA